MAPFINPPSYLGDGVYVSWDRHIWGQVWLTTKRYEKLDAMTGETVEIEHRIALGPEEIATLNEYVKRGQTNGTS